MNNTDIDNRQPPARGMRADAVTLGPVGGAERLLVLDVLRGLALCGVVISNMFWFSGLAFRFPAYRAELQTLSLDSLVYHAIDVFVSGKAIATLSFLFGLGFSMQLLRAQARGVSAVPLHCRRLSILQIHDLQQAAAAASLSTATSRGRVTLTV